MTIGEVAKRSGVATSALRFYEEQGLIHSERTDSGHRRYPRAVIRRVAFIVFAQQIGLSLTEIGAELARLPRNRVPERADWAKLSSQLENTHSGAHRRARAASSRASPNASAAAACRSTAASSPIPAIGRRAAAPGRATGWKAARLRFQRLQCPDNWATVRHVRAQANYGVGHRGLGFGLKRMEETCRNRLLAVIRVADDR